MRTALIMFWQFVDIFTLILALSEILAGHTGEFKIRPILKKVRALAGIERGQRTVSVIQWIGISHDEIMRRGDTARRQAGAEGRGEEKGGIAV